MPERPPYPHGLVERYALHAIAALLVPACGLLARECASAHAQSSAAPSTSTAQALTPPSTGALVAEYPIAGAADRLTTLIRAVVAEATFAERDHRAILHVLARRAERAGVDIDVMASRYVSALKRPIARTWVLELTAECEQPSSWPASLDWSAHRGRCIATAERVRAFLAGELRNPCPGAWHWGSLTLASDVERAARAGWRRVQCDGRTANAFYRFARSKEK